jgi:hypothetical protein
MIRNIYLISGFELKFKICMRRIDTFKILIAYWKMIFVTADRAFN